MRCRTAHYRIGRDMMSDSSPNNPQEDARLKREAWVLGGLMMLGLILSAVSCIPQG
jgi:hypothetical protein